MFPSSLGQSISGKALNKGLWSYECVDIRNFAANKHKNVDDTPFGGGAGMVMRADVIDSAIISIKNTGRKIYMSPRGKPLTQKLVQELSVEQTLTILCGRYEGVDQRVLDKHEFEEISIGDYVLSGGEPATLILMDACIRLLGGVMGNTQTADEESFSNGLLEYPHYTKPAIWDNKQVPEILTSGHHKNIEQWRFEQSLSITKKNRQDLWQIYKKDQK